jgi:hypothetical protein
MLPRGIETTNPDTVTRHEFTFGQDYIEKITNRLRAAEENEDVRGELTRIAHFAESLNEIEMIEQIESE